MAMFQLDIAWLLEVSIFAAGLTLLHLARQKSASLLRAAAWVLLVGSLSAAACSIYFASKYRAQGEFDHAYPQMGHPMMGPGSGGMMGPGMIGPPASRQSAVPSTPPAGAEGGTSAEHRAHHPEGGAN